MKLLSRAEQTRLCVFANGTEADFSASTQTGLKMKNMQKMKLKLFKFHLDKLIKFKKKIKTTTKTTKILNKHMGIKAILRQTIKFANVGSHEL